MMVMLDLLVVMPGFSEAAERWVWNFLLPLSRRSRMRRVKMMSIMMAEILTAEFSSSKSSHAEKMPVVRVSMPRIFMAPNSLMVSSSASVRPAMMLGLASGSEMRMNVEVMDLPSMRDDSM